MLKSAIVAASMVLATAAFAQGNTQKGPGQSEFAPGHQTNTKGLAPGILRALPGNRRTRPVPAILKARQVSNRPQDQPLMTEQKNKGAIKLIGVILVMLGAQPACRKPRRPRLKEFRGLFSVRISHCAGGGAGLEERRLKTSRNPRGPKLGTSPRLDRHSQADCNYFWSLVAGCMPSASWR